MTTSLQKYIDSIKDFGRITKDEEKVLANIIFYSRNPNRVKEAKEKMVHCNLFLVVGRGMRYAGLYGLKESDTMDLISEGNIGLVRAVELYRGNHQSGAGFATYALYSIEQRMNRFINLNRIIHVPESYLTMSKKMDELEFKYKDKLTDEIIKKELDISQDFLLLLKEKKGKSIFFLEDVFSGNEDGGNWSELIEDKSAVSPCQELCSKSLKDLLDKYMTLLNEREVAIIKHMHYSDKDMTLNDISDVIHVSIERVRQIYLSALRKLRAYMIKKVDVDKENESKKTVHYSRRGISRNTGKTLEEQEVCAQNIVDELL